MSDDIKEKVIELFDNYFASIENEYNISDEKIQYLKEKVKQDVKVMSFGYPKDK